MIDFAPDASASVTGITPRDLITPRPRSEFPDNRPKPWALARRVEIRFDVSAEVAPALRSAIEEISNDIGGRLTGSYRHSREQALTDAAIGLAALRKALFAVVPAGDVNYV